MVFKPVPLNSASGLNVLVFGSKAPDLIGDYISYVHTYSIAQLMAKANAVTVLVSSLQMYFNGKHVPTVTPPVTGREWQLRTSVTPGDFNFRYDKPVAIDIETSGNLGKEHTPEEVHIISIAMYDGTACPVVWTNPNEDGLSNPLSEEQLKMFAEELPKYTKAIYHNGKFDTRVLNRVLGVKLCVWFDTMLAHHVLNHAAGEHGLKALAMRYLGAEDWEGGIKQYLLRGGHYERIPADKITVYNGWDVYWTFQLWKLFEPQIEMDEDNQKAFMVEMSYADLLLDVEMNGIPFDSDTAYGLGVEQSNIMDEARVELRILTENPAFNPNSPQQVKKYLNDVWKLEVAKTDEDTIKDILKHTERAAVKVFCELLLKYRKASKIKGTYAEGWKAFARKDEEGQWRVHPTFFVHGTSTGRLSSKAPNAQNMPREKKIRKIVAITEPRRPLNIDVEE